MNVKGDVAYTCETAGHFYMYQILTRMDKFDKRIKQRSNGNNDPMAATLIDDEFPFHKFFDNAQQPLFKHKSFDEDLEMARSCFR